MITHPWQRNMLAGISAALLIAGFCVASMDSLDVGTREFASGTLLKVGFVLGLFWIAAPQLERFGWERLQGTMLVGLIIVGVLWSLRPRIGAIAAAILVAGSLFVSLSGWLRNLTKPPHRRS